MELQATLLATVSIGDRAVQRIRLVTHGSLLRLLMRSFAPTLVVAVTAWRRRRGPVQLLGSTVQRGPLRRRGPPALAL